MEGLSGAQFEGLLSIALELSQCDNSRTAIAKVLSSTIALADCERCSLFLVGRDPYDDSLFLYFGGSRGVEDGTSSTSGDTISSARRSASRVAINSESLLGLCALGGVLDVDDASAHPKYVATLDSIASSSTKMGHLFAVPVRDATGKAIAVLQAINSRRGAGSASSSNSSSSNSSNNSSTKGRGSLSVLESMAVLCGTALDRLAAKAEAIAARDSAAELLSLVTTIASAGANSSRRDEVCAAIVNAAYKRTFAQRAALFLVDESGQHLVISHAIDLPDGTRFPISKGIVGQCVKNGVSIAVADAYSDPRFYDAADKATGTKTVSILCSPIFDSSVGEVVGALYVLNRLKRPPHTVGFISLEGGGAEADAATATESDSNLKAAATESDANLKAAATESDAKLKGAMGSPTNTSSPSPGGTSSPLSLPPPASFIASSSPSSAVASSSSPSPASLTPRQGAHMPPPAEYFAFTLADRHALETLSAAAAISLRSSRLVAESAQARATTDAMLSLTKKLKRAESRVASSSSSSSSSSTHHLMMMDAQPSLGGTATPLLNVSSPHHPLRRSSSVQGSRGRGSSAFSLEGVGRGLPTSRSFEAVSRSENATEAKVASVSSSDSVPTALLTAGASTGGGGESFAPTTTSKQEQQQGRPTFKSFMSASASILSTSSPSSALPPHPASPPPSMFHADVSIQEILEVDAAAILGCEYTFLHFCRGSVDDVIHVGLDIDIDIDSGNSAASYASESSKMGLIHWITAQRSFVNIRDVPSDDRYVPSIDGHGIRSLLAWPVSLGASSVAAKSHIIAFLIAVNKKRLGAQEPLSGRRVHTAKSLASSSASAPASTLSTPLEVAAGGLGSPRTTTGGLGSPMTMKGGVAVMTDSGISKATNTGHQQDDAFGIGGGTRGRREGLYEDDDDEDEEEEVVVIGDMDDDEVCEASSSYSASSFSACFSESDERNAEFFCTEFASSIDRADIERLSHMTPSAFWVDRRRGSVRHPSKVASRVSLNPETSTPLLPSSSSSSPTSSSSSSSSTPAAAGHITPSSNLRVHPGSEPQNELKTTLLTESHSGIANGGDPSSGGCGNGAGEGTNIEKTLVISSSASTAAASFPSSTASDMPTASKEGSNVASTATTAASSSSSYSSALSAHLASVHHPKVVGATPPDWTRIEVLLAERRGLNPDAAPPPPLLHGESSNSTSSSSSSSSTSASAATTPAAMSVFFEDLVSWGWNIFALPLSDLSNELRDPVMSPYFQELEEGGGGEGGRMSRCATPTTPSTPTTKLADSTSVGEGAAAAAAPPLPPATGDSSYLLASPPLPMDGEERLAMSVYAMFSHFDLLDHFSISDKLFFSFLSAVRVRYHPHPYHNWFHAVSVTQNSLALLASSHVPRSILRERDQFAMLIAALGHDIDHPGHNNAFEVAQESHLSLLHSDDAVLERHHAHVLSHILAQPSCALLQALPTLEDTRGARRTILRAILATDMSHHFDCIKALAVRRAHLSEGDAPQDCPPFNTAREEERNELAAVLVHSADLGTCSQSPTLRSRWEARIMAEFRMQAERERIAGMAVTPLMANLRSPLECAQAQLGFITHVVAPLWQHLGSLLPGLERPLANIEEGQRFYETLIQRLRRGGGGEKRSSGGSS